MLPPNPHLPPDVRLERPSPTLAQRGLRCLLDGPEHTPAMPRSSRVEEQAAHFLTYAQSINLDLSRMIVALRDDCLVSMALWVPSPGKTAVLFVPSLHDHSAILPATLATMDAALAEAKVAGIVLVQVMVDTSDSVTPRACEKLQFLRLAQLNYMERIPPRVPPAVQLSQALRLESYSAETHAAFARAIVDSYENTLDCPELSGMRDIDDVLAGHKGVGTFDPHLWSVVMQGDRPIACLLLAEIPGRAALEIAYLGLAPDARGRGIGRALMQRTLAIACRRNFELLTLAVDNANIPAIKLYKRFGYSQAGRRIAYIKKLKE